MLAVVGILAMFNNRPIIVGALTLGYATLGLLFLVRRHSRGPTRPVPDCRSDAGWRRCRRGDRGGNLVAFCRSCMSLVEPADRLRGARSALLDMLTFYRSRPSRNGIIACSGSALCSALLARCLVLLPELAAPAAIRRPDCRRPRRPVSGADPADTRQQPHDQAAARPALHLYRPEAAGRGHHLRRGGAGDRCCAT